MNVSIYYKRFSLTLQQLFFRKLSIYFIRIVARVCSCHKRNIRIGQRINRHSYCAKEYDRDALKRTRTKIQEEREREREVGEESAALTYNKGRVTTTVNSVCSLNVYHGLLMEPHIKDVDYSKAMTQTANKLFHASFDAAM